jgi:fructokinase
VDTVGAGDAFSAGLLTWLAEAGSLHPGGLAELGGQELFCALDVAGRVASATCARPGADPPHRSEVADAPWP